MDEVWQWRIMRVNTYSRRPEPFYHCNRIGLDFNVASSTKKKLDLQLVTNGVILEVCDFAKTVNKSKRNFITHILENNFDLGLENEQQRTDFTARILHKVKDLIRKPPKDKNEVFTLFDTTSKPEFDSNDGLKMASTELTESFLVQMDDTDDSEHDDVFRCSQTTSKEYIKTEGFLEEIAVAHGNDSEHEDELKSSETQSAEELKEDVLPPSFPYCEEIGLYLDVGSKQSLDPGLLTKGVMLELVHFTRILTASYSPIVLGVLEHNFELDLKTQQGRNRVWFKISQLLKRRKRLITTGSKIRPEFKNEQFSFHTNPFKRTRDSALSNTEAPQYQFKEVTKRRQSDLKCKQQKRALLTTSERAKKRCRSRQSKDMETNAISDLSISRTAEGEQETCPQGESDLDSNTGNERDMEQEKMEMENNHIYPIESNLDSDIVTDSGSSGSRDYLVSSSLPTVKSNVNPSFASQSQNPRQSLSKYDMDQEEMVTKTNMWKLRANRVNQILPGLGLGPFSRFKHIGIEFNVGFGPKQNSSIDSLSDFALLKVAKFALAMNSSQQYFIMEILEYNFDFSLQSEYQRNVLPCEIMSRVRQLKDCEDAVKFSKEVFELPGFMPSINMTNPTVDSVEECDDIPVCPPHSQAETKDHISQKNVDLYPFCKEIGLELHVNHSRPNKKLDIKKLTNGAMTEVTNFAEELCGTFEQICLDILGHNFDLDLQSGDSDLSKNILARIPAIVDQNNLKACIKTHKHIHQARKHYSTKAKLDFQNKPNLDACSSGSSQATVIAQAVSTSFNTEQQNELNFQLWKLRANHIQQILSTPHEEHCPLYSYTRCKKLGIDFNVGSGLKQNLDPKLLTNGLMVELNVFATALLSAQKYFITEILEYNFHLHFNNELHRNAFVQQTMDKVRAMHVIKKDFSARIKVLFELPDPRCIQEPTHERNTCCPKCYQDRNHKLPQGESDPGHMHYPHPHTMTDAVSADTNCTAQKPARDPSLTFSAIKDTIMDSYPLCKKIGLNLCVDKDQPKDKLDVHVLTRKVMNEVAYFAKILCGTKSKILNDVIEHNFNIALLGREVNPTSNFYSVARKDFREEWFNEVFVIPPFPHRQNRHTGKLKRAAAMQSSEWKETIKKRKLALQTKEERVTLPSQNTSVLKKSKTNHRGRVPINCYPICTEIGLDLDVTSKSGEKEKLDLKLLTSAVVYEIYKFATKKTGQYLPHTVYDILDYNFDLSSQHHRRWEFSIATAFKVQTMVKRYHKNRGKTDKVFKLPFVLEKRQNKDDTNSSLTIASRSSYPDIYAPFIPSTDVSSSLPAVNSNVSPPFASRPEKRSLCAGEEQIQTTRNVPNQCDMAQAEMATEKNYICHQVRSDLDSDKTTDSGNTGDQDQLQNPKSCSLSSDIPRESESSYLGVCAPFLTTADVSSSLPNVSSNVNPPFASHTDERGLVGGEEQTQIPGHSPNECDMDQEEMGKKSNMWKLRANRVKQILSEGLEFIPLSRPRYKGLIFNIGFGPKQNISIDFLYDSALLQVAKFALAMNSSQQNFIMEILEYNFDISLQTEHHRNISTCEIMNRVRMLRSCDDTVKFSNEVFELPGFMPSINMTNQSMDSVKEECNDVPVCPPHSQAETKEHISQKNVDLYPFCKEIGLKLHVNHSRPNKKLDIKKLTNGAMTEVTNFAEELCGTFEQIYLDILGHNFDLDLQSGDSDLAKSFLARIPAIVDQKNLSNCVGTEGKLKGPRMVKLDCQNNSNISACSACSSQTEIIHQDVSSSTGIEYQDEDNLKLWQLRANHIQQILSIPHEEHCPFYSYSRCKKLGIDFNVGFGVKQNCDPKLLTNGVMVELNTFATALISAQKFFITEILECNFDLDLKDELYRSAFAQQTMDKVRALNVKKKYSKPRLNNTFELPDMRFIQKSTRYCPKCYQERNHKLRQDESDHGHMHHPHPHTMTDAVSADANCTAQKSATNPSSILSAEEDTLMDSYPRCKEIGLKLCVDKDQQKHKLDMHLLTRGVMNEVISIAKKLCGTKLKIINDVLEHNFNIGIKGQKVSPAARFHRGTIQNKASKLAWLNEVFVIQPYTHRAPECVCKVKRAATIHRSDWKEAIKKRQLALRTKEEKATLSSRNINVRKSKTNSQSKGNCFAIFDGIGLGRDMTSNSGKKEELDLKLLTTAACDMEQEEMRAENYYTCPLGESDLDSDEVTDSEDAGKQEQLQNPKHCFLSSDFSGESEPSYLDVCAPFLTATDVSSSLPTVSSNVKPPFASRPDERGLCGGKKQTQTSGNASNECDMDQEEMRTENNMWKLRANRVNQILSASDLGPFSRSKINGLEFNVGFGPKQNISVNSLSNSALLKVAKFALAMNSSQQYFIMEILEYNFDFSLQSEYQRNVLPCEIMSRVRQLKDCGDAVKFSKEVFELPGFMPSINMTNQSMDSVKEECNDVPVCPPHSQAETKDQISQKSVDLYPFCKEIGLKLHVNHSRSNNKLDIKKLTNGAMIEVTNFAEELCGTFEQIYLDILGHNFDLDLQSGDSDLAKSFLARIPAIVDQKNLSNCVGTEGKLKGPRMVKLDCQKNSNISACSACSSQTEIIHQDVSSSTGIEYQNEDNLKLWQLRANHIQQILSIPHEEHCPFYSYSRCKKLGIDFNVGFGVKQNCDPKLLTNGVMVELNTFATALVSAQKFFITEILECNFDLDLKDELYRSAFAQQTMDKVRALNVKKKYSKPRLNNTFELPDMRFIQKSTRYCPKCYQERNHKLRQDESDHGHMHHPHPHTMTDAVSADANCTAQKSATNPSSILSAEEDTLMDSYPRCKEIGLKLCVDKDQQKHKLDMHLLTRGVMNEVISIAKKLCGTKLKIINDVLEHNFNIGIKGQKVSPAARFHRGTIQNKASKLAWLNEVFVIQPYTHRAPECVCKVKRAATIHRSDWKEAIKKRQLALRTKEEKATLSSHNINVRKSKTNPQSKGNCFAIFDGIGLGRDMTSNSGKKEELDLKLLTTAACDIEQEEMRAENYYTCPLGESDLDSDEVTDSEDAGKQEQLQNPKHCFLSSDFSGESEPSYLDVCAPFLTATDVSSSLPTVSSNVKPPFACRPDERGLCGGKKQTQTSGNASNECDMDQEEMRTENNMWKLRANRVNQILSASDLGPFSRSKINGLEFNVGFGPKQNISVDSLSNSVLLKVAKFALAMNSSQQYFIMEILEYNFDFSLQSEYQRNVLPCEIMSRVRQLKDCEDAVKFSKEVFELPGFMPSINMTNQSMDSVKEECNDVPVCLPHSQAETKDQISQKSVDLYPFCKEIGLKLHVNHSRSNNKLDIKKLTNGAMTEVTNFAEELCGTFEQIYLDILGHNFDLDLQSGDSDLAKSFLARIPAIVDQKNLSNCVGTEGKLKGPRMVKLDCQNNSNISACSACSSQTEIIHQDVSSSTGIEYQNEDNLKLWQLRANHIQQILSIPHEEHCPFYSYSRCKKLGIDFNVGFGEKQNRDPKLLTNGVMVELNTFATALISAQKFFITEILECNFDLDLKDELYRSAFAQQTMDKVRALNVKKKYSKPRLNNTFELPDMRFIQKSTRYCPKCYQERNHKLRQDESDHGHMHHPHPHTMTDAVSADANCTAQKSATNPSSILSAEEDTLMDSYPRCKEIGLKLCVDKDQQKHKLDMHLLTRGVMNEVISIAKKLCGTKLKIINDVLEHNFNIGIKGQKVSPAARFHRGTIQNKASKLAWLNEVFVLQPYTHRAPECVCKVKRAATIHRSDWKEAIKKRQLALRAKEEKATLSSHNINVRKSKTNPQSKGNCFAIFDGIGLGRDMTSNSGKKEELDLKLLTTAACDMEQEEMRAENYYTCPLGESDLDSDEVTDSEDAGKQEQLQNPKHCFLSSDFSGESEPSYLDVCAPFLTATDVSSSLPTVSSNVKPPFASQPDERGLCGGKKQTQTSGNASNECDMDQEEMRTENNMWKLRANRVNQILSASDLGPFSRSKINGLEFNVGFGPKQNISVNSLSNSALLKVAKFALAMNSSQQYFIMEILEYNFDFSLQSEYQRNVLPCEIMSRVRQLKDCEDAVKFSKEVFELPGFMPSINMTNQSMDSVKGECNDVPVCPPHSQAETKDHISQSVDLYPFCKEIGLKLHVNHSRPSKKLDINTLTNGAMTEVTNFAEELCGTFEQICLDILGHNLDLDLQSGDSDLAKSIVARIPAAMEQKNLKTCVKAHTKFKGLRKDCPTKGELDCMNNPNLDSCSSGSSQATVIAQDVSNSPDIEHQNELDLKLWKLRASCIQQILSTPHEEHCPLYSYTRCKKLGIDFNVGSGLKQNLDPKLLTNGLMVELNVLATALLSAQKYFITEILEYNFHLHFNNQLHRNAFVQQTMDKVKTQVVPQRNRQFRMRMPFELLDPSYIQDATHERNTYCPKCYQDRNHKLPQDKSDPGHMHHPRPHTMTDAVSADTNCTAQKPPRDLSSTFSTVEKKIMDSYPLCKKIGLNLCVDKDQPKDKLDKHVLTRGIMNEVVRFAKRLCFTKSKIIHTVLEHNFNIGKQWRDVDIAQLFCKATLLNDGKLAWCNEVFEFEVFQRVSHRPPGHVGKLKQAAVMHRSERKETVKKRQLALQTKEERATLSSHNTSVKKNSKTNPQGKILKNCYPICTEIGLDLDVTAKSRQKKKLDVKLLSKAVVFEIHKFATKKTGCYLPHTVFDILDYNFDLSSQHHRRWEFSMATTFKIQSMVKNYSCHRPQLDKIFKLPFVFDRKDSQSFEGKRKRKKHSKHSREEPDKNTSKGHFVRQVRYYSDDNCVHFLDGVKTNEEIWSHDEDIKFPTDPEMMVQMNCNVLHVGCGSPQRGRVRSTL